MKRNHLHYLGHSHLIDPNISLGVAHPWISRSGVPTLQFIIRAPPLLPWWLTQGWVITESNLMRQYEFFLGFLAISFHCLPTGHEWEWRAWFYYNYLWAWWPEIRANPKEAELGSENSDFLPRGLFPRCPKAADPLDVTGILTTCSPWFTGATGVQRCSDRCPFPNTGSIFSTWALSQHCWCLSALPTF